jgi:hypothetical protein
LTSELQEQPLKALLGRSWPLILAVVLFVELAIKPAEFLFQVQLLAQIEE